MNTKLNYLGAWREHKNNVGTINYCLSILFDSAKNDSVELAKIFTILVGSKFAEFSNKQINDVLYKSIKQLNPDVGETIHVKRVIKGAETIVEERKKLSVFKCYQSLYKLAKKANK